MKYKVLEELQSGSAIGAHSIGDVIEVEDDVAAEALVASGHLEVVTE